CLLHGVLPFCRLRCFHVVLKRLVRCYLFFALCIQLCLAMAAAVGLCDCAPVVRFSSFAVALSLCWWGRGRATVSVELRSSGREKAPTAADVDGLCFRRSDRMT
ncbi:putative retrotransposon hot spot (RHS) protein, partial [Trypanosoma cruzi]